MDSFNKDDIYDRLSELLNSLKSELLVFNKILEYEHNVLNDRNFDELSTLTDQKKIHINNIANIDNQINTFFTDNSDIEATSIKTFIGTLPENDNLKRLWEEQLQSLLSCNKINAKNKILVNKQIQEIHRIIDIIEYENNHQTSTITYNQDGINQKNNNLETLNTKA